MRQPGLPCLAGQPKLASGGQQGFLCQIGLPTRGPSTGSGMLVVSICARIRHIVQLGYPVWPICGANKEKRCTSQGQGTYLRDLEILGRIFYS